MECDDRFLFSVLARSRDELSVISQSIDMADVTSLYARSGALEVAFSKLMVIVTID